MLSRLSRGVIKASRQIKPIGSQNASFLPSRISAILPALIGGKPKSMELDHTTFPEHLPEILRTISTCAAVVVDLELSGVSKRGSSKPSGNARSNRDLQQRYSETREAAQKYGILQVGITILQSLDPQKAESRTYNINLNPAISKSMEDLGLERDFTLQSSALQFLLRNNFDLGAPFTKGASYLSQDEEARVLGLFGRQQSQRRQKARAPLQLREEEVSAKMFVEDIRKALTENAEAIRTKKAHLLMTPPSTTRFTGFHRKLIHGLLDSEFPQFFCKPYQRVTDSLVVSMRRNPRDDTLFRQEDYPEFTMREIRRQIGFRWVIDALCNGCGSLKDLDLLDFPPNYTQAQLGVVKDAVELLRTRKDPIILAGHNFFNDLVYIYQWFIRPLPEKVEDFQAGVHETFPKVIDTKYVVTADWVQGEINPESSLDFVYKSLEKGASAKIDIHPDFKGFSEVEMPHQAGYDSYISACALLRMADLQAKLDKEVGKVNDDKLSTVLDVSANKLRIFGGGASSMMDLDSSRALDPETEKSPRRVEVQFSLRQRLEKEGPGKDQL